MVNTTGDLVTKIVVEHTPDMVEAMMKPFEVRAMPDGYAEWYYKDKLTTPEEIADIANKLYRDFCLSTVGARPLTTREIEIGLQIEAELNAAAKE